MSCGCGQHKDRTGKPLEKADTPEKILPAEECVMCAEKHLSTAYALAQERGYVPVNRQRIIGELVACQWHIWKTNLKLAESIRDIRHLIQHRREVEIFWEPVLSAIDSEVQKEITK
jgi:hypothetical protein